MHPHRSAKGVVIAIFSMFVLVAVPAFAQIDLSGQWRAVNQSDSQLRSPGPDLVDFTGVPLNADGRAAALAFNYSMISMTERNCMDWSANYITSAPHDIVIERVDDPVTGGVAAWKISGGGSDRAPIPIWIDGRPAPGPLDLHTYSGFTTGEWEGDVLTGHMTHMKRGFARNNGAPLSDQATMTIHVVRRGNFLEIMTIVEDPIYLEEPYVKATAYQLNPSAGIPAVNPTCVPSSELPSLDPPGSVPHWLPGQNPFVTEFSSRTNLPAEAVLGAAETLYPEFRKKLEGKYTPPASCTKNCR